MYFTPANANEIPSTLVCLGFHRPSHFHFHKNHPFCIFFSFLFSFTFFFIFWRVVPSSLCNNNICFRDVTSISWIEYPLYVAVELSQIRFVTKTALSASGFAGMSQKEVKKNEEMNWICIVFKWRERWPWIARPRLGWQPPAHKMPI